MTPKLCINCKHYLQLSGCQAQCTRKEYIEPVHGLSKYIPCSIERDSQLGTCKYEGIHYATAI
jgi:hypothetical protein